MPDIQVQGNKIVCLDDDSSPATVLDVFQIDVVEGKVGIGTTSPAEKLEVTGNAILDATDANIKIKSGSVGTTGALYYTFSTDSTIYGRLDLPYDTRSSIGLRMKSTNSYPITIDGGDGILFAEDGTAHAAFDTSGNLGIGTTSPSSKLEVDGDVLIGNDTTGNARINSISGDSTSGSGNVHYTFKGNEGTGMRRVAANTLAFDTTANERVRIDSAGNVGIGETVPSAPLTVTSTTGGVILPRMTTTQKNAISSPANGEMVYDTTDNKFYGYANGAWVALH